jgi:hypothetical protein
MSSVGAVDLTSDRALSVMPALLQAQKLADMPQINTATVQSLKSGVFMNILGGGLSQCAFWQRVSTLRGSTLQRVTSPVPCGQLA